MSEFVKLIENHQTFQGEGADSGRMMVLLRFKLCNRVENKQPCKWCDTLVRMRITSEASHKISDIQDVITENKCGILITGGEPTYDKNFDQTIKLLNTLEYSIANVETNGFLLKEMINKVLPTKPVFYSYSPKFWNVDELKIEKERTRELAEELNVRIKVVYEDNLLMAEYLEFINSLNINSRTYLMPQGVTRDEIIKCAQQRVFDVAEFYKVNFSSRDHIIYGFI